MVQLARPTFPLLFAGHCRSRTLRALTSLSLHSNFSIPAPVLQSPSSNIKYNALALFFTPNSTSLDLLLYSTSELSLGKQLWKICTSYAHNASEGLFRLFHGRRWCGHQLTTLFTRQHFMCILSEPSGAKFLVLRCVFNSWYVTFH